MDTVKTSTIYRVLDKRSLTDTTFVIRLERNGMEFLPGQHIVAGITGDYNTREYSIYSGDRDPYLEILVKEVADGYLTKKLRKLSAGDQMNIYGPMGYFIIDPLKVQTHKFVFIASGTGIAPFRSFVRSYSNLDYKILHGVRYGEETYESEEYVPERYISCTSRDDKGKFQGRVTDYLKQNDFSSNTLFYFCGNSEMIFEAMQILSNKGIIEREQMFNEVYF